MARANEVARVLACTNSWRTLSCNCTLCCRAERRWTLRARWTYEDGQVVDESTRAIAPNNRERTEFHISKPDGWPTGQYQVEVFLDGRSVEMKKFEVKAN